MKLNHEQEEQVWEAIGQQDASGLVPEQVHFFAYMWNWDAGVEPLFSIIRDANCEKATASLIYWRADPIAFYDGSIDIDIESLDEFDRTTYDLMKETGERFTSGFYTRQTIEFDPEEEGAGAARDMVEVLQKIPPKLMKPVLAQASS